MTWAEFKQQVLVDLPMDNARIGIATGNPNYLEHQLLYAIIEIQKLVPFYQQGHETIYGQDDVVREGLASVGSLPSEDQCRPGDAYFKNVGNVCVSHPFYPYPWGNRYDLICGNPRLYNSQFYMAIDRQAKTFIAFPSIGADQKIVLAWEGVKTSFDNDETVPFDVDVANAVSLFVKSRISRLVDHDLAEAGSYYADYVRARAILFADTRERNRLNWTASSPSSGENCGNGLGTCADTVSPCTNQEITVEDTISFCAFGDSGDPNTISNTAAVASLVKSLEPDFIMQLGDIVYPNGQPENIQDCLLKYYGLYIPENFLFAYGNHDVQTDNGDALAALFAKQAALNEGKRYYAYVPRSDGHLKLFVLNSETPNDQDMWDWLEAELAVSSDFWNVIAFHKSPYMSDELYNPGITSMRKPYKDWGAHLVISAHGHEYERLEEDGLPYIVCGLGGGPKRNFSAPPAPGSQRRYNEFYGALYVTARQEQLQATFFNTKGETVDSLAVEREVVFA